MTAVWFMLAAFIAAPGLGQALRWHDQVKARRLAEEHRITPHEYLAGVAERTVLTPVPDGVEGIHIGTRQPWPARQTPTDLAAAYETPAPAPDRAPLDGPTVPVREQATIGDRYACDDPCTARHCIHHAGIVGSIAQRFRWNTDTAEFSLLGLTVPDFPPLPDLYSEVT